MYIYLITCEAFRQKSLGKIGSTENPQMRMNGMITMCPPNQTPSFDLVYDGIWKTNASTREELYIYEMETHRYFSKFRMRRAIKDDTEWFDFKGGSPYEIVSEFMKTAPWMVKQVTMTELYPRRLSCTMYHIRRRYHQLDEKNVQPIPWKDIVLIQEEQAKEIYRKIEYAESTHEMIWSHKQFIFREALNKVWTHKDPMDAEKHMSELWDRFYMKQDETRFWNIYFEKYLTDDELIELDSKTSEKARNYLIMNYQTNIPKRQKAMKEFLAIMGMKHSQEHITIQHHKILELEPILREQNKRIISELGFRQLEIPSDTWRASNVIDCIKVILSRWGASTFNITFSRNRMKDTGKQKHVYTMDINNGNILWDII